MVRLSLGGGHAGNFNVGASNVSSQPPRTKRPRTEFPPTLSATASTSAAYAPSVTVQENDTIEALHMGDDEEEMEYDDEEESGSEEEGSDDGEEEEEVGVEEEEEEGVEEEEDGEEEDGEDEEDEEYQTDQEEDGEGSEDFDARDQGQAIGGRNMASNDVSSGNTAGAVGTTSLMLGTFTDTDVLDCPICYDPLTVPVFQCENGHLACSSCCSKIVNKCPSCSCPMYIRCRPIERILNSVKFSCRNMEYGCNETILYGKRELHEMACIFGPCSCPLESCDYVDSSKNLYAHFRGKHLSSAKQFDFKRPFKFWLESKHKRVILQEKTDATIFVLNNSNKNAINLIHIGALHYKEKYCYELSVAYEDSTLKLKSYSATMSNWSASQPLRKYLLVPLDFVNCSGSVSVTVCIEKRHEF